jgi:putative transposase
LCHEDTYLLELVRYVHLNPIRARLVENLDQLGGYAYCGHGVLMGKAKIPWQDTGSEGTRGPHVFLGTEVGDIDSVCQ